MEVRIQHYNNSNYAFEADAVKRTNNTFRFTIANKRDLFDAALELHGRGHNVEIEHTILIVTFKTHTSIQITYFIKE